MSEMMTFTLEAAELTASVEERTISGKIVPMGTNEVGNTSAGAVIFERDSIEIPEPKSIRLLAQHDIKQPLGRAQSFETRADGVYAVFSLSRSSKATDYLLMAQEGLVTGLSVGVEVKSSKPSRDGIMHVTSSVLREVSAVTEPAFKSAQITKISAEESAPAEEIVEENQLTESEAVVENTPAEATTPEVETPAVEASRPTVSVSTSTNTGLTLPTHLNTFITDTFSGRPVFDAVTRSALTETGMSFTVPRLYTNAGTPNVAPTVATTAEAAAPSETGMTSSYDTVSISKMSGLNRVSFELIDRSSPAFMELLMGELRKAYEKATDTAVLTELISSGTAAATTAATAAGLQSFISTEGAAAYKGTGGDFANKLVVNTDQWAAITGYADTTGRALYSAQGATYNASGTAVASSVRGNILGTDLIVDHNIAASGVVDNSAFLIAPSSVYVWESPTTQLRLNVLQSGEVEINLYGYLAIYVAKSGKGVRKFNLT